MVPPSPRSRVLQDRSSLSNPHEVTVTHLQWDVKVDFDASVLRGVARYTLKRIDDTTPWLSLDTSKLVIRKVADQDGQQLDWSLDKEIEGKPHLGSKLDIELPDNGSTTHVEITYETTPAASALQWLPPSQTAGKERPYLFTQCQAIHARSLLPCQDRPGVKVTYRATVTVPSWSVCVMSAVQMICRDSSDNPNEKVYVWMQDVPISSYLIAMAVGQLERKEISHRCAVWSEPAIVNIAAMEYSQTEDFLQTAEAIAGMPYVWGRYDLLCLPPSFPYGGMENPCLTFITPTTLAGDKSLADVVAHEIAHSWTGNLVTNATWDHFWLNEGWTKWFERKIMARIHGDDRFLDFDALGGYKDLRDTVSAMPPAYCKLVLDIGDRDPDDSYSIVAYEKGFNLLMALERRVGKQAFETFFQAYVKKFANKTLTSDDFKEFFMNHFAGNAVVQNFDWNTWLHEPGMPPEEPNFDKTLAAKAEHLAQSWMDVDRQGKAVPKDDIFLWTSNQKICFLDTLQTLSLETPLKVSTLNALHEEYGFGESQNSEILFRYCQLALAAKDETILPVVLKFATSQGRMKFTRPLFRALFLSPKWRPAAKAAFLKHQNFYHPICAKMVASDLMQIEGKVDLNTVIKKAKVVMEDAKVLWKDIHALLAEVLGLIGTDRRFAWGVAVTASAMIATGVGMMMTNRSAGMAMNDRRRTATYY